MIISTVIRNVIRFRVIVLLVAAAGVLVSAYSIRSAPLDAIPDISDPQIVIYAKWPRSPQLLETEVTEPLIRALLGSPGIQAIRGTSHMGYSFIYVILSDPTRREQVREAVLDRVNSIRPNLPSDAAITLGPNASSMGWIFEYALVDKTGERDLRDLRLLNDNQIKPALQTVPGIAEVASVGGLEKQFQLKVFPPLLAKEGVSLKQLTSAVQNVFQEAGGRTIEITNREYQLRGVMNNATLDKLEFMVVGHKDGKPVQLKDIGYLQVGYDLRRSIADLDGSGEVVGGIAVMEQKQNVLAVTRALEQKLQQVQASLPEGVEIVTTYNRSSLIWETLQNFFRALVYELFVVILVIVWALRNFRAAAAPVCVLVLGCLFTVLPLAGFNQTINLFSLAGLAIAIGEMADATIVIVENCTAELARRPNLSPSERKETIIRATATMTRPLLFSMLIMLASFLPIFFLGEREGRLFNPLAYSKTFAMAGSTLLTLFLLPVIIIWVFRGDGGAALTSPTTESAFVRAYRVALHAAIRYRYGFVAASVILLLTATVVMFGFQKDYMPEMEEGSVLYMPSTLPGLPVREAGWILQQMDKKLKEFPEVERVFGKLGRADTATDPAPITMIETTVLLKPKADWRKDMTKEKLVAEMNQAMTFIGYVNTWTQPVNARVMMQDTGIQTPVGIKVKGNDTSVIENISQQVEGLLRDFPGTKSIIAERVSEGYFVDVNFDFERLANYGIPADEAMLTVRYALGGENIVRIKQSDNTMVPLGIQYSPEYVDTMEKIRTTPVISEGRPIPLNEIAEVSVRKVPEMIRNDDGQLAGYIYVDLQGVTAPDYVEKARPFLAANLKLPAGYSVEWTGLYRYSEDARSKLRFVVPLTLIIMFALLLMAFKSAADSSLIMLSAPFALIGGIFLQWTQGFPMTTAVIIGYVSLFAVAMQTGIIMIEFIREALANRMQMQLSYKEAVIEGSVLRLRPKLMTVATTVLGLLPIMLSSGSGMDITQPIATPTLGGMISSTLYVLFLIPCLFVIGEDFRNRKKLRLEVINPRDAALQASTKKE